MRSTRSPPSDVAKKRTRANVLDFQVRGSHPCKERKDGPPTSEFLGSIRPPFAKDGERMWASGWHFEFSWASGPPIGMKARS